MKKLLKPRPLAGPAHLGVAVVRVVFGVAMVLHGLGKFDNPDWKSYFSDIPEWQLEFAQYAEVGGGALLALGLVTPVAALLVLGVMGGAIKFHLDAGDPFVKAGGGWELAGLHAATALLVLTTGPGVLSLDQMLFAKRKGGGGGGSGD